MGKNRLEAFSDGVLTIIAAQGPASNLRVAIGNDWKGKLSPVLYASGIVSTLWWPWVALALYVTVALLWLVPDRRIERSPHADGAWLPYVADTLASSAGPVRKAVR